MLSDRIISGSMVKVMMMMRCRNLVVVFDWKLRIVLIVGGIDFEILWGPIRE